MKKSMKVIAGLLSLTMAAATLAACGSSSQSGASNTGTEAAGQVTSGNEAPAAAGQPENDAAAGEVVEITYATYMVGTHVSAKAEAKIMEEFNTLYGDRIKVTVEELPSDDSYVSKMKTLAASKALPDVVMGKEGIRELAVKNGQAVDLLPLLESDADWKKWVGDEAIAYNLSDEDGKLYSIANGKQLIGYYYNTEMFAAAGIKPAETWDEFMTNNEKLKAAGFTPLALMTGENCWTTNLWLAAYIGSQKDAGNQFMQTRYPDTYQVPEVIDGLKLMQTMLTDYTTSDAVGAIYANAANNFCQEKAAMIANGPWMVPDFTDPEKSVAGFGDKVDVAMYPESGLIEQYEIGYVLCTNGKDAKEQAAALEFLKFKTSDRAQEIFLELSGVLPLTPAVELSDDYVTENPLVAKMFELSSDKKYGYENIDNTAYAGVIEAFAVNYPDLVYGSITPEAMAAALDAAAEKSK